MPSLKPFLDELPIPEVIRPVPGGPSAGHLTVAARPAKVKIHSELPAATPVWCYRRELGEVIRPGIGTTFLGPTVEVKRGETVTVAWKNEIDDMHKLPFESIKTNKDKPHPIPIPQNEPGQQNAIPVSKDKLRLALRNLKATLVTHLHGARVQADSDGWPDNTVAYGQTAHYTYHNQQASTMLWYHDHCMHVTRVNVFAGLAGAWLIRDDDEHALHLPSGDHELPLVIQDRNLDTDVNGNFTGALLHKAEVNNGAGPAEFFGPYTLVNGMIWPKVCVESRLYRLRLLNGSNARTYRLSILDQAGTIVTSQRLWQIGCDQGLMEKWVRIPDDVGLVLAPAERADVLIDFSAFVGQSVYLWNTAEAPFGNDTAPDAATVKAELLALLNDPHAQSMPESRRPYGQVMRFDIASRENVHAPMIPSNPILQTPPASVTFTPKSTVRVMGLVEQPAETPVSDDATTMLVFYEFLRVSEGHMPPGTPTVQITYYHPGTNALVTESFWKAAEGFYDQVNWLVHLDSAEFWYIVNLSGDTHPIHVHLVDFEVQKRYAFFWNNVPHTDAFDPTDTSNPLFSIDTQGKLDVEANARRPKDTVRVNPNEMVGIAITFSPYPGRFMYHCHILEHEDHDMMRPFVVVPPWVPHHEH